MYCSGFTVRVAARRPPSTRMPEQGPKRVEFVSTDIRDDAAVSAALTGAEMAVNAVGLYTEHDDVTFHDVHVDGARRVAEMARLEGVRKLGHISGVGADRHSESRYVRCRAEGEIRVRRAFGDATIFRPCVMFGDDDAFLQTLISLVGRFPVLPLFGRGRTRLQPVCVEDVAAAVARTLSGGCGGGDILELGGPTVYSYRELLRLVAERMGHRRVLIPVPFAVWDGMAAVASWLPHPPLTPAQVALMKRDNIPSPGSRSLSELGVTPTAVEAVLKGAIGRQHE